MSENMMAKFFNSMANTTYVSPAGNLAHFIGNVCFVASTAQELYSALKGECDGGHPTLSYDPDDHIISQAMVDDPLSGLKARMREELLAEMAASAEPKDMGDVVTAPAKPIGTDKLNAILATVKKA